MLNAMGLPIKSVRAILDNRICSASSLALGPDMPANPAPVSIAFNAVKLPKINNMLHIVVISNFFAIWNLELFFFEELTRFGLFIFPLSLT